MNNKKTKFMRNTGGGERTPPPTITGGDGGLFIRVPRERLTVICPDCGDVTTIDKERFVAGSIFNRLRPPCCSQCGTIYRIVG